MTRCLSPDAIARVAMGSDDRALRSHLADCAACAEAVEVTADALRKNVSDAAVAPLVEETTMLVAELMNRSDDERPAAAASDRYASCSVARQLIAIAVAEYYRDLNVAMGCIHAATVITGQLSTRAGRAAEVEFEAWKHRSSIHRKRGEFDAARASILRARVAVDGCIDRELKGAVLDLAEAIVCSDRDVWQPEQSLALLDRCEPVFMLREPSRLLQVDTMRGIVHLHREEFHIARTFFAGVVKRVDPARAEEFAEALRNLANPMIFLGDFRDAKNVLRRVRAIDEQCHRTLDVVRDDALLALLAYHCGNYSEAACGFEDVRARFAAAGEHETSMLAGKDCGLSLVAAGDHERARGVFRRLANESLAGGTDRRRWAAEALFYLRDLADAEQLTTDVAVDVCRYLDKIHGQRATPFRPPMPQHLM